MFCPGLLQGKRMDLKESVDLEIKAFLDEKVMQYNTVDFIETDPISIPHRFTRKEDIEIAGFLAASIAWGNRVQIVKAGHRLMNLMGDAPYDFVMCASANDLKKLQAFVYRTFNAEDITWFIKGLRHIYSKHEGLEQVFLKYALPTTLQPAIHSVRNHFLEVRHRPRSEKHLADPNRGSAAKRINLFLRWMIRKDRNGVDFGIWKSIDPSALSCPLDVHSGRIARQLGLLGRLQDDAKAVVELDQSLRLMDAVDPVKYDFALFGLGIFEGGVL